MLKRCVMVMAAMATSASGASTAPPLDPASCKPAGQLMSLTGLPEASGLVASRAAPGRLWSHNDSGKPELIAFDAKGTIAGHLSISGARVEDWEALATAPCGSGSCLYVADIGDNEASRKQVPDAAMDRLRDGTFVKRLGDADDIYGTVAFLATDDAAWVTGQTHLVNGGFNTRF